MAESFLYHGVLLMLFDHLFDPFLDLQHDICLGRYFPEESIEAEYTTASSYEFHPVLGASYRFFLTISDITRFARRRTTTSARTSLQWQKLDLDLQHWENTNRQILMSSNPGTSLYTIAARALLTKAMSADQMIVNDCLELYLRRGLATLKTLSIDTAFSNYYLWPLAVLGCMASEMEDRALFQELFNDMTRKRRSGLISWVRVRLQRIWNTIDFSSRLLFTPKLEGLRILLEEGSLDCTTVSE